MKNIIVGPAFPLRGGIANLNESLCKAFIERGIDSEIVSFTLQYPTFLFPGKTQFDNSGKAPENIKISQRINSVNPVSWIKTANYIISQKPDYVIFRYWLPFMAPALGTIAKKVRKSGIKVIAIADNVIPHENRLGDKQLTNYFLRQCDGFVAMSKSVLKDIDGFVPNAKSVFIPHPIYDIFGEKVTRQEAAKHLGMDETDKIILFFGFIRKYKGLDLLLESLGYSEVKSLNVKLIVAGEFYEDEQPYMKQVSLLGIENNVIFKKDFIPQEEVKYYFCAANLVAQPYYTATQSGVTQIAYHFERPMLVTNVGGLAEIVPNNKVGYVCETNSRSVTNAIIDFFQNNREQEFVNNIKVEKKRFSWDNMINGIEELVKSL